MSSFISVLKGIFSGDTLIFVILFAVFFAYASFLGRGRLISLILAFFPATTLFNNFPFINSLLVLSGDKLVTLNKVVIFLIFLVPISYVINRYMFATSDFTGSTKILRTAGLSICAVAMLLIFSYSTVSLDTFYNFSPQVDSALTGMSKLFYWNVGVLALLAFL
jgi:hypothetical protein